MTDGSSFLLCSTSGDFEIYSDDERVQKLLVYKVEKFLQVTLCISVFVHLRLRN